MDELPAAENTVSLQAGPFSINLRIVLSLLALAAITVVSFWAALNPAWIEQAGHWGYLGAAFISFLSSATVVLPAPGLAVVFSMGGVLNPVLLGILAGIGSGLGELSGYVAGASGRALISQRRTHPFVERLTTRYTAIALFLFAVLPLPLFDFAGIVAGAMRVRMPVFLGTVISGKIIKHIVVALMGAGFLPLLRVFIGM